MQKTRHDVLEILPPPGLRLALNASPSGRRRASLRPGGGRQQVVHFSDYRRTEIINPTSSEINLLPEKNGLDNGVHRSRAIFAGPWNASLPNRLIHLHDAVFSSWILLFIVQVTLVSTIAFRTASKFR